MTFPAIALGLVLGALEGVPGTVGTSGLLDHVAGLILAFALTYPLWALRMGLGTGDAKFLMGVGALRGVSFFIPAALLGSIIGGVLALILIVLRRLDPPETQQAGRLRQMMMSRIPYGVALALGVIGAILMTP